MRTALLTFGVDASHGYERIHLHALMSVAKLAVYHAASEVQIERDAEEVSGLRGFTRQKVRQAEQDLKADEPDVS